MTKRNSRELKMARDWGPSEKMGTKINIFTTRTHSRTRRRAQGGITAGRTTKRRSMRKTMNFDLYM
jgi:hypothetical protein